MGRKDRERLAGELERRTADFDGYYSAIWGGRWASIRSSLLEERRPVAYSDNLVQPYYMDEASICTARLLPLADGDRVLDMCAAPGGKTPEKESVLKRLHKAKSTAAPKKPEQQKNTPEL